VTGEPIWPIIETPVPQSTIPGEQSSPTQPIPSLPQAWEIQGITHDDLVDFTPELRASAIEALAEYKLGPLFNPPIHQGNPEGYRASIVCPSATGGTNATGGASLDPETNILYVSSVKQCTGFALQPGAAVDDGAMGGRRLGRTVSDWVRGGNYPANLDGLPILKPPYGRITAIDMDTGETLWWIPNGDTPDRIKNLPALQGLEIPVTGQSAHAHPLATRSLMIYGEGRGGTNLLHAVDKLTGEEVGRIELPAPTSAVPMSIMHEGVQYIIVSIAGGGHPGSIVALRLPPPGGGGPGGPGGGGGFGPGGPGGGGPGGGAPGGGAPGGGAPGGGAPGGGAPGGGAPGGGG
jgi:quinoprotein glucose dehydrogenase